MFQIKLANPEKKKQNLKVQNIGKNLLKMEQGCDQVTIW
jgi:hypothetical protein